MANFPTLTFSNVKHKVANGVSNGTILTRDEEILVTFNNGVGNNYKVSYNSPFNQITGTATSNKSLSRFEIRVTPVESSEYGPGVGQLAYSNTSITSNTAINFTINVTTTIFSGSSSNNYRVCLMGQSDLDYSWDCTQFFMVIDTNTSFTNSYTEVEYLESLGGQYINTSYIPNINSEFSGKFLHTEHVVDTPLYGVRTAGYSNSYTFWAHPKEYAASGKNTMIFNDKQYQFPIGYPEGTPETFYCSKTKMQCNDQVYTYTATSGSPNLPLILFGLSNGTNIDSRKFVGRVYEFKISESGSLVRDFVPCIRNSDNKPGMYDRVNNVFYTNQGSGEFKYGPLKSVPQTYQQVEYISTNTTVGQYIDTNWIPSYTDGFDIEIKLKPSTTKVRYCLLANYNQGNAQLSLELNTSNQFRFWANTGAVDQKVGSVSTSTINTIKASYHGNAYTINCNGTSFSGTATISAIPNYTAWLFLDRARRTSTFTKQLSIYSCIIWSGNQLVRNFIPCYRKSDNVIGMLDLVNNVFYTNAGSGTFLKGTNITNTYYVNYKPTDADGYDVHHQG